MPRSVQLYTPAQSEEVMTFADQLAKQSDLPSAERDKLAAFQTDPQQTLREDRRRTTGAARLPVAAS